MRIKADSDQVRRQNRSLVLESLRQSGPQARIELGRITHLSPATVTTITGDLLHERLIRVAEIDEEARLARGRPLVRLELNPKASSILAIRVSIDQILLVLADFSGQILTSMEISDSTFGLPAKAFASGLVRQTRSFLQAAASKMSNLRLVSVAVQGIADTNRGEILWSPAFSIQNIPITGPLEEALGVTCKISNDANMIAQALLGQDARAYGGTAAVAFIGYGVGMGMIINGSVYAGPDGQAAEFGHMNHMPGGPLCRCGRRGCIEAYAADYAIHRRAHGRDESAEPSHSAIPESEMRLLEARAEAGDAAARDAFAQAGRALGFGFARLIALLDPQAIALAGPGTRAYPLMKRHLEQGLTEGLAAGLRRDISFNVIPWNQDMITDGIIAGALRHLDRDVFARPQHSSTPMRAGALG